MKRPNRNGRRRSRQCRGRRARNYFRTVVREANGSQRDGISNVGTILAEAQHTGALAASKRLQERSQ